jgi:hypothetical protein
VLGQIVTALLPAIMAAAQSGNLSIGGIISQVIAWRCWRRHTHGDHWRNQKQSCCLTGAGSIREGNIAASINLVLRLLSRSRSTTAVNGFHRIRHCGFFANTSRAETIAREREPSVLRLAAAVSSSREHHA